jgi:hypothetical protein
MEILKSNQRRVQNLTPWEIWAFIAGRVLVAFGLGVLAAEYFPVRASQLALPVIIVGVVLLLFASKGLFRKQPTKD